MTKEKLEIFYNLETSLHKKEVRNSSEKVSDLLADEFVEFGANGGTYYKKDTIERLGSETFDRQIIVSDFRAGELSTGVVLVTYTASLLDKNGKDTLLTNRSSVWVFRDERWQMSFHQGTLKQAQADESDIESITEELKKREPIFHHPELGVTREDLEKQTSEDFWEIGASGSKYDRKHIIDTVVKRFEEGTEVDTSSWKTNDFTCRPLSNDTYALTYILDQGNRLTRRLTLWQNTGEGWKILYHQGTTVNSQ